MKLVFSILLLLLTTVLPSITSSSDNLLRLDRDDILNNYYLRRLGQSEKEEEQKLQQRNKRRRRTNNDNELNKKIQKQPRIVGGDTVSSENDYPWFVEMEAGCGASLIYENIILTAGHCIESDPDDWEPEVWIGSYEAEDGEERRINGYLVHPEFDLISSQYDFALATLDQPTPNVPLVEFNRNRHNPAVGDRLTVLGLGNDADTLQQVQVPFVSFIPCFLKWLEDGFLLHDASMICAGGEEGRDSCSGDSGGPLLDSNGVLTGVASFGIGCGEAGWPAIYSRVSSIQDWIDEFICIHALSTSLPSTCGNRCRVDIIINHGDNPDEISWSLSRYMDNDNRARDLLFVAPPDDSLNDGSTYTKTMNLSPGHYSFRIVSFDRDGIDDGNYMISIDCQNTVIQRNGDFGDNDEVEFEIFLEETMTDEP